MTHARSRARRSIRWLLVGLVLAGLAEIAARSYGWATGRVRLLTLDAETGWRTHGGLDHRPINAVGRPWHVHTDARGHRILAQSTQAARTLIILGDSFAFGEGVAIERRFDAELLRRYSDLFALNFGVMGFGLDQSYLAARPRLVEARAGDVILILFYRNDFKDTALSRNVGRPKPRLMPGDGMWTWQAPAITWLDRIADRSLVVAALGRGLDTWSAPAPDYSFALARLVEIVMQIRRDAPGMPLMLAHFGDTAEPQVPAELTGNALCVLVDRCIALDAAVPPDGAHYFPDGHWSERGHEAAGAALAEMLVPLLSPR